MRPNIRLPANTGVAWKEYNDNVERAIELATDELDDRITAIEEQLVTLTETAEVIADALTSIEQMTVTVAAAARVQTDILAKLEALTRGRSDPLPSEEGDALIRDAINKEAR